MFSSFFVLSVALAMARSDIADLYPQVKGNLTKVTWAHAVNNYSLLKQALDSGVMMMEADVGMGKIPGNETLIPIMCHPPNMTSDLSLEGMLSNFTEFNNAHMDKRKGIKLDFKSIEAFENSIEIINKTYSKMNYPIWMNADILPGPMGNATPVDAARFLAGTSKNFPTSTLSISWTTSFNNSVKNASYKDSDIDAMLNVVKTYNIKQNITYPIRVGLGVNSIEQIKRLLLGTNNTVTMWSAMNDTFDMDKFNKLIAEIGIDKIYLDVPANVQSKLVLPMDATKKSSGNNLANIGLLSVLVALCAYFIGMCHNLM